MDAHDLTEGEILAARGLSPVLAPTREIFRELVNLVRACNQELESLAGGAAVQAQRHLLPRLADDLAGTCALASLGYGLQSLVLASSAFEVGHLSAFVARDDARASRWLSWTDLEHMPWGVKELVKGAVVNAGMNWDRAAERQYLYYTGTCWAKHSNPVLQLTTPRTDSDLMHAMNADPQLSPNAGSQGYAGMFTAAVSAVVALRAYVARFGVATDSTLAVKCKSFEPRWKIVADNFDTWRRERGRSNNSESTA